MIKTMGVHIKTKDFEKSKRFYEALGFRKVFEYGKGTSVPEDYSGIVFDVGGAMLELANGHRAVKQEVFEEKVNSSKISLMIEVEKLSAVIEVCNKEHIDIAVEPRHYYWGKLEMVLKDLDGVVLVFWAPYDEGEAKKTGADESWAEKPRK